MRNFKLNMMYISKKKNGIGIPLLLIKLKPFIVSFNEGGKYFAFLINTKERHYHLFISRMIFGRWFCFLFQYSTMYGFKKSLQWKKISNEVRNI